MFNLWLDYPAFEEELNIIKSTTSDYSPELNKIVTKEELITFQDLVRRVPVADSVIEFAVNIVKSSRPGINDDKEISDLVSWGAGPRASQFLVLAAKAKAIIEGRYSPNIDDIKYAVLPVLRHRIIPSFNAEADGITSEDIIKKIAQV